MIRIVATAAVLAACAALPHPARAQRLTDITGGQLVQRCTASNTAVAEQCLSYISGVADTAEFFKALRPADGSKGPPLPGYICVPSGTKGGQLRDAVAKWVKSSAEAANRQASGAVMDALYHAFPCKKD